MFFWWFSRISRSREICPRASISWLRCCGKKSSWAARRKLSQWPHLYRAHQVRKFIPQVLLPKEVQNYIRITVDNRLTCNSPHFVRLFFFPSLFFFSLFRCRYREEESIGCINRCFKRELWNIRAAELNI